LTTAATASYSVAKRRLRGRRTLPRAAAAEPEITEEERAALIRGVERAAATLDEIVEEVSHEVFVSEATAYIYSEDPDVALADAVRGAVTRRLEWLDSDFLAAVGAYTEAAGKMGNGQLVELLEMLRKEVLGQVRRASWVARMRLPPAAQLSSQQRREHAACANRGRQRRASALKRDIWHSNQSCSPSLDGRVQRQHQQQVEVQTTVFWHKPSLMPPSLATPGTPR
jgi:hypothetical protein